MIEFEAKTKAIGTSNGIIIPAYLVNKYKLKDKYVYVHIYDKEVINNVENKKEENNRIKI